MKARSLLALLFSLLAPISLAHASGELVLRVLFVRHGEKPEDANNHNLSCKGYNRSIALPKAIISGFGTPSAIFVPKMILGDVSTSTRMFQTVTPLAVQTGLQINTAFAKEDHEALANELKSKSGLIIVVWEHKNIEPIVRKLGVQDDHLKWHREDFDSIWVVDFKENGLGKSLPEFKTSRENISPSPDCPF